MTHEAVTILVDYHYWARDRLLAAVSALSPDDYLADRGSSFGSIRGTLVHLYLAERIWLARWQGVSPAEQPVPGAGFPDLPSLVAAWTDLEGRVRTMVREMTDADLGRVIDYRRVDGEVQRAVFWHMLQHVVNHGTHHRGQVTTLLRQIGAAPPDSMDLITYYRQRPVV